MTDGRNVDAPATVDLGEQKGILARAAERDDSSHPTLERLNWLAYWLDDRFQIPGTRLRVGADGLIGLVPGVGDTAMAALSAYILFEAIRIGVPKRLAYRMVINICVDYLVGLVPFVGDIFDIGWKANRRNVRLLVDHMTREQA